MVVYALHLYSIMYVFVSAYVSISLYVGECVHSTKTSCKKKS